MLWQDVLSFHDPHLVTPCSVPDSVMEVGRAKSVTLRNSGWRNCNPGLGVCTHVSLQGRGTDEAYIPLVNDDFQILENTPATHREIEAGIILAIQKQVIFFLT